MFYCLTLDTNIKRKSGERRGNKMYLKIMEKYFSAISPS